MLKNGQQKYKKRKTINRNIQQGNIKKPEIPEKTKLLQKCYKNITKILQKLLTIEKKCNINTGRKIEL